MVTHIAHAYGNSRELLARALAAPIDVIEADVRYGQGELWIRHERRLGPLPVLADRRHGHGPPGPFAMRLYRGYYLRLDVQRFTVSELIGSVAGKKRLLLDLKSCKDAEAPDFALALTREIRTAGATGWVAVCGQFWAVLNSLRRQAPEIEVRYSIERRDQWERYTQIAERGEGARRICIEHRFLDDVRLSCLKELGADIYCWTVDDPAEAAALVARGVDGIISNDLPLLAGLRASGGLTSRS